MGECAGALKRLIVLCVQEARLVFEKLYKYVGKSLKSIVDSGEEKYCLRLQKSRVFYVRESLMKRASNVCECINDLLLVVLVIFHKVDLFECFAALFAVVLTSKYIPCGITCTQFMFANKIYA